MTRAFLAAYRRRPREFPGVSSSSDMSGVLFFFLVVLVLVVDGVPVQPRATCGYQSCPAVKPGMINVHLVPHTHDDVGWLKTVDQYYYGSKMNIQRAGVQYIIDSVVSELAEDPNRRFIYVETAFFWRWWVEQDEATQNLVKSLVDSGQLEFIGGAWSMNDEAAAHYHSTIDQFTYGLRKLSETFGSCAIPHVGWQIDPFGHSREMASLFSQMGYDALFFARLDHQDKDKRVADKTTEMIWRASSNLDTSLFTSVLYYFYGPPSGFCFDVNCNDEPIIDNPDIPDYNVDSRVNVFIDRVNEQAKAFPTNNIIMTMGGDFTYIDANMWYTNLDKLIRYVNERQVNGSNINVFYSTPSCYAKAVSDASPVLTEKSDDFFPYSDGPDSFWTGYFTSRPTSKGFERVGINFLQVCKQLRTLAALPAEDDADVEVMQDAVGILQHHDAITGTAKQAVFQDYTRILHNGFSRCGQTVQKALSKLTSGSEASSLAYSSCLLSNVSQCEVSETAASFVVTVYNALSRPASKYVRLPVAGSSYSVRDAAGTEQTVQLVPVPAPVLSLRERSSEATAELVFQARDLPPLGFRSYYVSKTAAMGCGGNSNGNSNSRVPRDLTIGNDNVQVLVDETTGLVKSVTSDGVQVPLSQNFFYYEGHDGDGQQSGAYIFRPRDGTGANQISATATASVHQGPLVEEIHQTFTNWVSQVIRVYKEENSVEFEWMVGPIPIDDDRGKEVVSRFSSGLSSGDTFYTDSNGREMLERRVNFRPSWDLTVTQPVAGNYYPVTAKIAIKDPANGLELAVLNDRAQGGASLSSGEVELMVHRRLLHDDARGVGEALNETAYEEGLVVRGVHTLVVGPSEGSAGKSLAARERELALQKRLSPWVLLAPAGALTFDQWASGHTTEYSALTQALPSNVQILTLETRDENTFLLRLEHILEKNEDPTLSQQVSVDLSTIFSPFTITSVSETLLGANQLLSATQKLPWKSVSGDITFHPPDVRDVPSVITLDPMQIRTFLIDVSWNAKGM